jgi:hypothetical protein
LAEIEFQANLKIDSDMSHLHFNLAKAHQEMNDHEKAIVEINKA